MPCFFLISFFIATDAHTLDTCQQSLVHGYHLEGSVRERIVNIGLRSCAKECLLRAGFCRSFNYEYLTYECEINDKANSGSLTQRQGFTYSSIDLWSKDKVNECKDIECAEYFKCFIGAKHVFCAESGCPSGHFGIAGKCEPCPVGQFKNSSGKQWCTHCPTGTYQDDLGSIDCKKCTTGTFQNGTGSSGCFDCEPGTYQDAYGQSSSKPCPVGHFSNAKGSVTCTKCEAGSYQYSIGTTSCLPCPAGTYMNQQGKSWCNQCPDNTYQDETGKSSCKDCPTQCVSSDRKSCQTWGNFVNNRFGNEEEWAGYFNLEECQNACREEPTCVAISHKATDDLCYIHRSKQRYNANGYKFYLYPCTRQNTVP